MPSPMVIDVAIAPCDEGSASDQNLPLADTSGFPVWAERRMRVEIDKHRGRRGFGRGTEKEKKRTVKGLEVVEARSRGHGCCGCEGCVEDGEGSARKGESGFRSYSADGVCSRCDAMDPSVCSPCVS